MVMLLGYLALLLVVALPATRFWDAMKAAGTRIQVEERLAGQGDEGYEDASLDDLLTCDDDNDCDAEYDAEYDDEYDDEDEYEELPAPREDEEPAYQFPGIPPGWSLDRYARDGITQLNIHLAQAARRNK